MSDTRNSFISLASTLYKKIISNISEFFDDKFYSKVGVNNYEDKIEVIIEISGIIENAITINYSDNVLTVYSDVKGKNTVTHYKLYEENLNINNYKITFKGNCLIITIPKINT